MPYILLRHISILRGNDTRRVTNTRPTKLPIRIDPKVLLIWGGAAIAALETKHEGRLEGEEVVHPWSG